MGTEITPQRQNIFQEEIDYRSGGTERTFSKIGASMNFINERQIREKKFALNGNYSIGEGDSGIDGLLVFMFDAELVGLAMSNVTAGSSGTTTLDVHWYSSPGTDEGSIFTTRPAIDSNAPDGAYLAKNLIDGNTESGTGLTLPVFSKTEFSQFDALRLDLDSAMEEPQDCDLILYYRPR